MIACPECSAQVAEDARFCSSCGTKLQSTAPPPTKRRSTADGMKAERRQLTVMFCDIAESTEMSEKLDPEDLMEVVRRYQAVCVEVIESFGGNIAQYLGDGLLVYFGFPTAFENAPERAARAGLEILDGLDTLNEGLGREFGVTVKVRLGIHTGLVVIGEVGAGAKREQLAVGDTANIAARLESLAAPNSGVVSNTTRALVMGVVETESMGIKELKGIATPMEVYRLMRVNAARQRQEDTLAHMRSPFVGREAEMATLEQHWKSAEGGQGAAVLIRAEAGVGKSRMIPAFQDSLRARPLRLHQAYGSPFYVNSVLHPIVEMLRAEAEIGRDDVPGQALDKLRAWLERRLPAPADALALLAVLLEIPKTAGYDELDLSPPARKLRTFEALLACLLPGPEGPTTLLILEDMHWVDPSTLELVDQLVTRLPEHHAMLLMTTRPTFESPWAEVDHVHRLALPPFTADDTRTLVLAMTEGRRLPESLLTKLVERTDGIPLFVEELTRMLMDAGELDDTKSSVIPMTLHDSLMARLDRIDPVARKVAQLGATIGRVFDFELLRRIFSGSESELRRGIDELSSAQLVHSQSTSVEAYTFRHALIQDAAYESLLKKTRQRYHERIADALEEGFGHRVEVEPELLAHHLEAAGRGRLEAAVQQWLKAGEKAQASSSNKEAVSHLKRGLGLLTSLPDNAERVQLELSLLSKLGTALSALIGYAAEEVEQTYARAHALCETLGPTPERFWVLWGLWAFYLVQGTHKKGVRYAEMMLELATEQQAEELELEAHFSLGLSFFFMGDDLASAREHLEWVVSRYDAERHHEQAFLTGQDVGVTSRSVSALVHFQIGEFDTAMRRHQDALALSERLGHAFSRAYALGCAAWFRLYTRDYEVSQGFADEAVTLSQEQSFGWWLVWGMILGGSARAGLGVSGAATQIEQGLALWRQSGSGFTVPYFLGLLAEARSGEGDHEGAAKPLAEAITLADESGERFFAAELRRFEGELRLALGEDDSGALSEVEVSLRGAMSTAHAQGARSFELRAAIALAQLLRRRGHEDEARRVLMQAHEPLADLPANADLRQARALLETP